jgi:DNA-binding MarR family transcriptional regulator
MDRDTTREFEILTAIGEGRPLTQRALSQRLGVALGLTNLYLKRVVGKGYVKISRLDRRRLGYLLTARGLAQRSRLTYEHMTYWASLYRRARGTLREGLAAFLTQGMQRVALYGTGEPGELAYITLRELGIEPIGVFDREAGGVFLGYPVRDRRALAAVATDAIIIATFDRPDGEMAALEAVGVPRGKFIPLRPSATNGRPRRVPRGGA